MSAAGLRRLQRSRASMTHLDLHEDENAHEDEDEYADALRCEIAAAQEAAEWRAATEALQAPWRSGAGSLIGPCQARSCSAWSWRSLSPTAGLALPNLTATLQPAAVLAAPLKEAAIADQRLSRRLSRRLLLLPGAQAMEATAESRLRTGTEFLADKTAEEVTLSEVHVLPAMLRARLTAVVALGPSRRAATATTARGMLSGGASSATPPLPRPTAPT